MPLNPPADDPGYRTRAQLRSAIVTLLGWAAIANNPPPGVAEYVNEQLRLAHWLLWQRFPAIRLRRWFSWALTTGERFYPLDANVEQASYRLDPYGLAEAWLQRDTQRLRLRQGLPHGELDRDSTGWPSHFALHSALEVWPAPADDDSVLLIYGRVAPTAFTADDDTPGVPDDLVQLLALAACKRHYQHADANDYIQMQEVAISNLVAGSHGSTRYLPGETCAPSGYVEPVPSVPFD